MGRRCFLHITATFYWVILVFTNAEQTSPLTVAENIYINLSGACRVFMDLSYNGKTENNESVNTIKIVQLDGYTVRTFPIDEAYVSLTQGSTFDITKQTKIVFHGFKDSANSAVPYDLARAYNEKVMFNVLLVDAEELLNKWYVASVQNARLVGKRVANLLANLENYGTNAEDFHLLGISLGAHIAGWVGKYFYKYKGRHVGRISGLDPAGPCFSHAHSDQRLDKSDAVYVDVVHSNRLVQGIVEAVGHSDFYLNGGGPHQPGCMSPTCSHLRAAQVYTESIRSPKSVIGLKCDKWKDFVGGLCAGNEMAVLGYGSSTATRGLYHLRTAAQPPYALEMNGTRYQYQLMDIWMNNLSYN